MKKLLALALLSAVVLPASLSAVGTEKPTCTLSACGEKLREHKGKIIITAAILAAAAAVYKFRAQIFPSSEETEA